MAVTEGKHDDPADTLDRLVRVGTKYVATAPTLTDGDNAYFLVDAAGRVILSSAPVAHDGVAAGNPVRMGGVYRTTLPAVAALDIADILLSAEGRPRIEEYMIQQTRIGNHKYNNAEISKTTAAEANVASWTVTNGKTGYIAMVHFSIDSHASETRHEFYLYVDTTLVFRMRVGQGHREVNWILPVPHKLAGDGTKTITARVAQATVNASVYNANLVGWEE